MPHWLICKDVLSNDCKHHDLNQINMIRYTCITMVFPVPALAYRKRFFFGLKHQVILIRWNLLLNSLWVLHNEFTHPLPPPPATFNDDKLAEFNNSDEFIVGMWNYLSILCYQYNFPGPMLINLTLSHKSIVEVNQAKREISGLKWLSFVSLGDTE